MMNIEGLDLPTPTPVEHSDEALRAFPQAKRRTGVARNCKIDVAMCRVKIDGQRQYQTEARAFWRLRK